jgi:tRNA G10  N-methylase Trm11
MPSYAAFLGHLPSISVAELSACIPDFRLQRLLEKKVAIFETEMELDSENLDTWGGTMLLARQIDAQKPTLKEIPKVLAGELASAKGKVTFGLRSVGVSLDIIRDAYREGKKHLKKEGKASRYVGNERQPAATILLHDAGLLNPKEGCELVILKDEDYVWMGRTIAAQDPNAYTKRDMEKPVRDTRLGMLPPKLAQVMLNMGKWLVDTMPGAAKPKKTLTVLDPFCGMGVIPMETLLRGWPVMASDLLQRAVDGCEKNLDWLRKEEDIKKKDVPSTLWKQDACKPFKLKTPPDVIVTETHLGPALTERPNQKDAAKMRTENDAMQREFLENVAATLPGVPLVVTWPVWNLKTGTLYLEQVWEALPKLGYRAVLPRGIETDNSHRLSLMYRRPDHMVGREIILLQPVAKK